MKKTRSQICSVLTLFLLSMFVNNAGAQNVIRVIPEEIEDVLINPGIGFTTFQRFNGDDINEGVGWTEGFPIDYQEFDGNLENPEHPMTSIAYFRVYWRYVEPDQGKYNWEMLDRALKTARERRQTLMLRIAPYGQGSGSVNDVPDWYRAIVGQRNEWLPGGGEGWRVDAEDPRYAASFGKMISEIGKRYDGHPDLEAVDLSIVGFWGEGRGSEILTRTTREALVNAYTDNFKKTPLIMLLTDEATNKYGLSKANVGWRVDCIGDLGFWGDGWNHMFDYYPQSVINFGMKDAWKSAPVSLEVCGTFRSWVAEKGTCQYCQGYTAEEVGYIIDETLKWHISSFNNKSSGIPEEWRPQIDGWLKRMGYRFVLRSFIYPETVSPGGKMSYKSWWDNKGVAPCYKKFLLAVRLKNDKESRIMITDADITAWLPGDNIHDDSLFIPADLPEGDYELQVGITDRQTHLPVINLAIAGRTPDGWYKLGTIGIRQM